jgi:hypothetical protein
MLMNDQKMTPHEKEVQERVKGYPENAELKAAAHNFMKASFRFRLNGVLKRLK